MKGKRLYLLAGLVLLALFIYRENLLKNNTSRSSSPSETTSVLETTSSPSSDQAQKKEIATVSVREQLLVACPQISTDLLKLKNDEIARNTHFEKNGESFTLRVFLEDGDNGSYKKLVLLKNDSDGFGEIQEIDTKHEVNPTKEIIDAYLEGGKIIRVEKDLKVESEQESLHFITSNDELFRVSYYNQNEQDCQYEKGQ